ncbi:hypothetical protein HK097_008131 [Rhizophlyctis rosea]|uniref:Myb-like domain-containing protein n=1 Tax=Rhizophlyctis rosea TaxID=64517 RepID=A0AAD5X4F7_9FUNG|nr:hypothetical protein HK097_008131 [Rhizophlyctis rosea]
MSPKRKLPEADHLDIVEDLPAAGSTSSDKGTKKAKKAKGELDTEDEGVTGGKKQNKPCTWSDEEKKLVLELVEKPGHNWVVVTEEYNKRMGKRRDQIR